MRTDGAKDPSAGQDGWVAHSAVPHIPQNRGVGEFTVSHATMDIDAPRAKRIQRRISSGLDFTSAQEQRIAPSSSSLTELAVFA